MVSETLNPTQSLDLAEILAALSHPKRLRIFDLLMEGVHCNCEIAERLGYAPNLISHHLRVLEETGLVQSERDTEDARWVYYTIDTAMLARLQDAIARFLDESRIQPRAITCGPRRASTSPPSPSTN